MSFIRTAALVLVASASGAAAQPGPARPQPRPHVVDDVDQPTLSAAALEVALTPYLPMVRACYLGQVTSPRATGHLRLELIIHRDGTVFRQTAVAPGVPARERRRLDACLRKTIATWSFPVRRSFTTTAVPFYFQRTRATGAGPKPSCWSPRGCPARAPATP